MLPDNNSFSELLAVILLVARLLRRARPLRSAPLRSAPRRAAVSRRLPSAVRLSATVTSSRAGLPALYLLAARAPDMQLWFNLIFASDTDQVLDGGDLDSRARTRLEPNQSWPSGSTEVMTALETI